MKSNNGNFSSKNEWLTTDPDNYPRWNEPKSSYKGIGHYSNYETPRHFVNPYQKETYSTTHKPTTDNCYKDQWHQKSLFSKPNYNFGENSFSYDKQHCQKYYRSPNDYGSETSDPDLHALREGIESIHLESR